MRRLLLILLLTACHHHAPPRFRFSPRPNRAAEIHWREWGEPAFAEARAQKKRVFLSLAAIWCHWCHVLDETSLSDPRVIARLNEGFIPVRVDADQHPDVERRYLLGGWPTVAVLDADGQIVDGGTYLPPDELLHLLETARGPAQAYRALAPRPAPIPHDAVENVSRLLLSMADFEHGGFGRGAKFPQADAVRILLQVGERDFAKRTLDAMLALEDPVEGGFYRYATQPDWTRPHYEKMLTVQAELIALYFDAAKILGQPRYAAAAHRASEYVRTHLFDEKTGDLWASQDADERYYTTGPRTHPPFIDKTLLVDRAGEMIWAWAHIGERALAEKAAARIQKLQKDGLFQHGEHLRPLLGDQAWAALALKELGRDVSPIIVAAQHRWRAPSGALYDGDALTIGLLREREQPLVENCVFARASGDKKILEAFAGDYLRYGDEAATWALSIGQ